jgi:hypothetical protein
MLASRSTYVVSTWAFLRLLGIVYLIAFASLAVQVRGLIGHDGILPAQQYLAAIATWQQGEGHAVSRFWQWPTVFWLNAGDRFLDAVAIGGAALGAAVAAGIAPALLLPVLWLAYLSFAIVCRDFLGYQWDALLLEAGLLAIPLAPLTVRHRLRDGFEPPPLARWLFWWLLFRFTLGSGTAKLASGDPAWRNLEALSFHYETQPLPVPLAWYVSRLPAAFHKATTAAVLGIELLVPWLMFGPRRVRHTASAVMIALQVMIAVTGNYTFFNLLTIAICLLLFDDGVYEWIARNARQVLRPTASVAAHATELMIRSSRYQLVLAIALAIITVPVSMAMFLGQIGISATGAPLVAPFMAIAGPTRSVNAYGLFAVMTTTRPEIIVEGSNDGVAWQAYEFKYKPGDLRRRLPLVAPHQPRLDWQMWFAALSRYEEEPWYQDFCLRLLQGSPAVLRLLAHDPFGGKPPRFVRGVIYRYRFADVETRRTSGVWWTREPLGVYSPPLSLRRPADAAR